MELIDRLREWKRDRAHQQQQTDSESDSDDENECNGSRNDMMADSGWVETIRDKNYNNNSNKRETNGNNNKSEFMSKMKENEMSREFRQMNIGDSGGVASSGSSSGSDLMIPGGNGVKLQQHQNVSLPHPNIYI